MQVVYARCAGLDVHKKTVSTCLSVCEPDGDKQQQMRVFGTFTSDLLALGGWLKDHEVTHVAMEATGVYWRPVRAVLEGQFQLMLVNPQHIKAVPGPKADAKDCEWIADWPPHGLLRGSFVPPAPIQDLRDLMRYRAELRLSQKRVADRIQKLLEQANLKLSLVAFNAPGVSGRWILKAIIAGQDSPEQPATLVREKLKNKVLQLGQALEGRVRDHHRFFLAEFPDEREALGQRIRRQLPTTQHLASWAALCPGHHENTGKRRSGKTWDGNKWLRWSFCQAAWTVIRKKNCCLPARFKRLAVRRGAKRAVIPGAHTMLIICYHVLKTGGGYHELGGNYLGQINKDQLQRYFVKRLQRLGLKLTVEPVAEAAWGGHFRRRRLPCAFWR